MTISILISTKRVHEAYMTDWQSGVAHFSLGFSVAFIYSTVIMWGTGNPSFDIFEVGLKDFMLESKVYLSIMGVWLFSTIVDAFKE